MSVFFSSDTHFGHAKIIELFDRPFASLEEMNETIIENWNRMIGPRDEVWHLGDFGYYKKDAPGAVFDRLNGRKNLMVGNHDDKITLRLGWERIEQIHKVRHNKRRIVLCHYPFAEWDGYHSGALHIHGHQHNRQPWNEGRMDIGVDANGYKPWAVEEVIEFWDRHVGTGDEGPRPRSNMLKRVGVGLVLAAGICEPPLNPRDGLTA